MSPKVTEAYKNARRREIVQAADRVFRRKGYLDVAMQDVIDEVGLSRGAIYDYFDNKETLFRAVIEQRDLALMEMLHELEQAVPLWPALMKHLGRVDNPEKNDLNARRLIGTHIEYVVRNWTKEREAEWIRSRFQAIVGRYVQLLNIGVQRGEFHPTQPLDVIAKFMLTAMDGMNLGIMAAGPEEIDLSGQTTALHEVLKHLLQPSSGESMA